MGATTVVTRAVKGSALTHNEMDTNWNNLNAVGVFVGTVYLWPTSTLPDSTFLELNGQSITTASYPALFAVLGYTYGGSGANFNVPDYRGLVPRGWDHGAAVDPDAASRTNRGDGTTGNNVGTKQLDEIKAHTHDVAIQTGNFSSTGGSGPLAFGDPDNFNIPSESTGGLETRMKNIYAMYIIKAKLS